MKLLVTIGFLLVSIMCCYGQNPNTQIDCNTLNPKYLEYLIKKKVDSVRLDHHLKPLVNDSILYVAAKYHGNWMRESKKFSHYEKNENSSHVKGRYDPQQRAEFYGAPNTYLVGENIIKSYLNKRLKPKKGKEYINRTYGDLANDFVVGWVNSPRHYANIITPEYDVTGLAITINSDKRRVYAVQKFANILYQYEFEENKEMFSYSGYVPPVIPSSFDGISRERIAKKFAWKIKTPKDSTELCQTCNGLIDIRPLKDQFYRKGKKIIYKSWNIETLDEMVQKRRDGLAVELVGYRPYDCGNPEYYSMPSRRNNQTVFNFDTILKPLYRKELKRGFKKCDKTRFFKIKKRETADYFELTLGKMPKGIIGYHEINLVVIKSKKLCRVVHFTNYCGEAYEDTTDIDFVFKLDTFPYIRRERTARINFELQFKRGKSDYSFADIKPLLGAFSKTDFIVDSAQLNAYSSLEGSESINRNLQMKRANAILNALEERQTSEFPKSIQAEPNWKKFDQQIEESSELSILKGLSHQEIKEKLKDRSYAKSIEKFLSKQRLAVLRLDIHYQIKREHLADTLLKDVSMHYAFLKGNPVVDYVLGVQWAMYELIHEGYCTYAQFDRLSGFMNDISQLREQELWMNFSLGRYEDQMTRFYRDLVAIKFPSIVAQYDELNMDIRNIQYSRYLSEKKEMMVAGAFAHLITKVPDSLRAQLDTMELVFDMICVNLHGFNGGMPSEGLLDAACVRLKNHAIKMNLPEAFNFRIAKLYVEVNRDMHAYNLLTWMLLNGAGNDETKALFLKMGYFHSQE
ncbi:MAG: CAP domain-containing protein, partial [Flavobacteriales bacterium]|nr:CAP domain-containing protein [Flavobacteriales bacterium]